MDTSQQISNLTAQSLPAFVRQRSASRANLSLEERRAAINANAELYPVSPGTDLETVSANGVAAEWQAAPTADKDRCLLYFHGGGFVLGSPRSHRHLSAAIAEQARMRCLSVDYRLAPEHTFPAALDDCFTAYQWLLNQGMPAAQIALGGDSAGGGLVLSVLLRARDERLPLPAASIMLSPWTDLDCGRDAYVTRADLDPMITRQGIRSLAADYLGSADPHTPLASPVNADLGGLPPCLIQVGEAEVLLDDARDVATAIRRTGGSVELEVWDRMVHVWQSFHPMLEEGRQAVSRLGSFLQTRIADRTA